MDSIRVSELAKELNMDNTVYVNCTGLPAPEQYSCANDCAIVLKEIMKHPHYHTISSIWMDELVHPSGRKTELVNTNKLVRYYKGCDCGKTGSTNEAGYCLTTSAQKDDFRVICVVIGSKSGQDRFKDATTLLNYAFANFENKTIVNCENSIQDCEVMQGKQKMAQVFAKESYFGLCKKGDKTSYDISFEIESLKAEDFDVELFFKAKLKVFESLEALE